MLSFEMPRGLDFALYVIVLELLATYLVHCPVHYLVGTAVGIKFRSIRLGRTTLARVLPAGLVALARFIPVLTLQVNRDQSAKVPRSNVSAMYASGTVGSVCTAFIVASISTWAEPVTYAALAWTVAFVYLLFDAVFSPKSGDLMRARRVLRIGPAVTSSS